MSGGEWPLALAAGDGTGIQAALAAHFGLKHGRVETPCRQILLCDTPSPTGN